MSCDVTYSQQGIDGLVSHPKAPGMNYIVMYLLYHVITCSVTMDTDTDVMMKRSALQGMGKISLTCQSTCVEAAEKTIW